jgi:hypothetical protein
VGFCRSLGAKAVPMALGFFLLRFVNPEIMAF